MSWRNGLTASISWISKHESAWGILSKVAYANAEPLESIIQQLPEADALRASPWMPTRDQANRFAGRFSCGKDAFLLDLLDLPESRGLAVATPRICTACLERGFHSVLFQHRALSRCPEHDLPLLRQCPHCGAMLPIAHGRPYHCDSCNQPLFRLPANQWVGAFKAILDTRAFDAARAALAGATVEAGDFLTWRSDRVELAGGAGAPLAVGDTDYWRPMQRQRWLRYIFFEEATALYQAYFARHAHCVRRERAAWFGADRLADFDCSAAAALIQASTVLEVPCYLAAKPIFRPRVTSLVEATLASWLTLQHWENASLAPRTAALVVRAWARCLFVSALTRFLHAGPAGQTRWEPFQTGPAPVWLVEGERFLLNGGVDADILRYLAAAADRQCPNCESKVPAAPASAAI